MIGRALWFGVVLFFCASAQARRESDSLYLVKAFAKNKQERTQLVNAGITIDGIGSESVTIFATRDEIQTIKNLGFKLEVSELPNDAPFPTADSAFHDYQEMQDALNALVAAHPRLAQKVVIGKSLEGRDLVGVRISGNEKRDSLPTTIFLGCHHAREHLSVEVPLMLAQHLVAHYDTDRRIKALIDENEVYIVPMLNPDGAEYDISTGAYKYWRKNRRDNGDGTFGVDLNRNYGGGEGFFGGPGSSSATSSDVYRGPHEFSEPETAAVRDFIKARSRATMLLSFHTFSELVMWPYGHTYDPIANATDLKVFETMGNKMAEWNKYTAQKSSELYLASGDTVDWAYETHKIFAFTFELSPDSMFGGGFYPGAAAIEPTFKANLEPALYMIEKAHNPYSVIESTRDPLRIVQY